MSFYAAALRAASDKLTPKNRPKSNRSNDKLKLPFPNGRHKKTRSDRKARREKASALTRLRIAFFSRGGRAFVVKLRYVLFVIPPLFLRYCA